MSKYRITLNGEVYEMEIEVMDGGEKPVKAEPKTPETTPETAKAAAPAKTAGDNTSVDGAVVSPMPGTVVKVTAARGDKVSKGQPVLVLEAMKMENEITAVMDGVITEMRVAQGQTVAGGEILFTIG